MRDPRTRDTQPDEYIPDVPSGHKEDAAANPQGGDAINPRDTSSMPRGEDDLKTWAYSPEFHDRTDTPDAGTAPMPPDSVQVFEDQDE